MLNKLPINTFPHSRWLSAYLKGRTASCRYNFTLSPSSHATEGVLHDTCISPTLFNSFASKFPQSDNLLTNSYADDFTVSCSDSNVDQMAEALTVHSSNIDEWADERSLVISAPKSIITLFIPNFEQSDTHSRVILNNYPSG